MDQRLRDLATASPNFGRLCQYSQLLALYGAQAEALVFTDPNAALVHTRQFGEVLAELLLTKAGLKVEGNRQVDRLRRLRLAGMLVPAVEEQFEVLRKGGNLAAHEHLFDRSRALVTIRAACELGSWYHRVLSGDRSVIAFVPPAEPAGPTAVDPAELAELREALRHHQATLTESRLRLSEQRERVQAEERARVEAESLMLKAVAAQRDLRAQNEALVTQLAELRQRHDTEFEARQRKPLSISAAARETLAEHAQRPAPLSEAAARKVVDRMLAEAGWIVQDVAELNPRAGLGVVVREFRLATGIADYVLFVDGRIVGVIEAKREGETLSAAIRQNERYAGGVLTEHALAVWDRTEPFAFRYVTTGTETLFLNRLDPAPRSRDVFSFHRPETVRRWMAEAGERPDAPTLRARVQHLPALDTHGLRAAQVEAVDGVERSLAEDHPRALVQMATGAGKTFTAVTEAYRLLKYAKARRVLFLVDRNNLGRQALAEFRNYTTPDDGRKFSEVYNVDRLAGAGVPESSAVVISTIQKLYALLRGETVTADDAADDEADEVLDAAGADAGPGAPVEVRYNQDVPPESFDLIVVDECHRSIYGLWRAVLEYFDAHVVGLTATPTKQTLGFFHQNLVSQYTYQMAVADGVNVDFDLLRVRTKIGEQGSVIERGTTVRRRDRRTRAQRLEELPDDFTYDGRQLGRSVVAEDQIRTVLRVLKDNWPAWFPGRAVLPKTLIFAADDNHAEEVVKFVKDVFAVGDDFVQKITYKVRKAGRDPEALINALRNDPALRVAVTVDMIATGTDIRALECVVFLRSVRSAVLFEQMKGRGARTLDPTELREVTPGADEHTVKDQFILLDAVGVTDSPLVDATPLGLPLTTDTEQRLSTKKLLDKCGSTAISADEATELAGRLARLDRRLVADERGELAELGGIGLTELAGRIQRAADPDAQADAEAHGDEQAAHRLVVEAVAPLTENPRLRERILVIRRQHDITYDEVTRDELLELHRVPASERAQRTVASWHDYLEEHRDEVTAIEVIEQRRGGRGAAYAALKAIVAEIRHPPYEWTPDVIWGAYETLEQAADRPEQGAQLPDLVSLIRFELGLDAELKPYRAHVEERFAGWLLRQEQAGASFSPEQLWWLERIRDTIAVGVGISFGDVSQVPFSTRGGPAGLVSAFGSRDTARTLLTDLDQELA